MTFFFLFPSCGCRHGLSPWWHDSFRHPPRLTSRWSTHRFSSNSVSPLSRRRPRMDKNGGPKFKRLTCWKLWIDQYFWRISSGGRGGGIFLVKIKASIYLRVLLPPSRMPVANEGLGMFSKKKPWYECDIQLNKSLIERFQDQYLEKQVKKRLPKCCRV